MTYRRIRSLTRGIEVLRYLNTVSGAHPSDISKALNLPRPTVHRVLDTLKAFSLIYQTESSAEFRLTPLVRRLGNVKDVNEELRTAAWPAMQALTARVLWPCDLAVYQDNAMMIIESTHRVSPLSVDLGMVGRPRHLLTSPLGRAFLAHCDDEQLEAALSAISDDGDEGREFVSDRQALNQMIEQGRRDGYSMCSELPHDRCASLAVPVRYSGRVIGCMNLVWKVSDVTYDWARENLSGPLIAARNTIERRLAGLEPETATASPRPRTQPQTQSLEPIALFS